MCNILLVAHYYLFVMFSFLFVEYNYLFVFSKYLFLVAEINYLVLEIKRCKSRPSYNPAYVSNNWCTRYVGLLSTLLRYFLCNMSMNGANISFFFFLLLNEYFLTFLWAPWCRCIFYKIIYLRVINLFATPNYLFSL